MLCDIIISETDKERIYESWSTYDEKDDPLCARMVDNKITLKCVYRTYLEALQNYSTISRDIILIICEYTNDEIVFNIHGLQSQGNSNTCHWIMYFELFDTTINFKNVSYIQLHIGGTNDYITGYQGVMVEEDVLKRIHDYDITMHAMSANIYKMMQKISKNYKLSKKQSMRTNVKAIECGKLYNRLYFRIMNYEVLLIICDIVESLINTTRQRIHDTKKNTLSIKK